MMERIYDKAPMLLWYCNPELNKECKKTVCKYNLNAEEKLCEATSKKAYALLIGETAPVKEYTPGPKKSEFNSG